MLDEFNEFTFLFAVTFSLFKQVVGILQQFTKAYELLPWNWNTLANIFNKLR